MALWPLGFTLPNALRAAGDVRYCMVSAVLIMWFIRVVLAYPLGLGLMAGDFVCRAVCYTRRWLRGRWQEHAPL